MKISEERLLGFNLGNIPIRAQDPVSGKFATYDITELDKESLKEWLSDKSKEYIEAAVAIGVAGVFMEVHQDPDNAPSDGPNMVRLENLKDYLIQLKDLDQIVKF